MEGPVQDLNNSRIFRPAEILLRHPNGQIIHSAVLFERGNRQCRTEMITPFSPARDTANSLGQPNTTCPAQTVGGPKKDVHPARILDVADVLHR